MHAVKDEPSTHHIALTMPRCGLDHRRDGTQTTCQDSAVTNERLVLWKDLFAHHRGATGRISQCI